MDWDEIKSAGCVALAALALAFLIAYGCAVMEARAYYRVTGVKVSAWDAMFIELRVQEAAAPVQKP